MINWKRETAQWSRWLHIYLSMASFGILFFFAITGLTLNHQDRFSAEPKVTQFHGKLDPALPKEQIVAYLRQANGIKAALADYRAEANQIQASFKGPGYAADAFIDRQTGKYDITETRLGFIAIVNDLHKGRDTGGAWSKLIDLSAILMCLVSISGLTLIFFLYKRRASGLIALAVGVLLCTAVYWIWVS